MLNDKLLNITVGNSRKAVNWTAQNIMWSDLCEKLRTPSRSTESLAEYFTLPKSKQDELKDVGGFVGGTLNGNRRKADAVSGRDLVTLDLDSIQAGVTDDVLRKIDSLGFGYCVYSTRKHCEAAPRLRVLIPLSRTCSADEYEPLARKLAEFIGMEMCDPSTFEASRLMYWPSCSSDSSYVFTYADKPFIDVDGTLSLYADWRNVSEWKGVTAPKMPRGAKQADPTEKSGIVGAFCKTYDVYRVIYEIIPGVYAPCGMDGRFTYSGGSTTGGAVVYNDGQFLYSHHATDPAGGKLCNAFDLARLHMFGDKDDDAKPDTPTNKLPSYVEMCRFAASDKAVAAMLNTERYQQAVESFGTAPSGELENWLTKLEVSQEGNVSKTTDNVLIILENDPMLKNLIVYEEFSNRIYALGALPWDPSTDMRIWTDNDDAGLRHYLEKVYKITGEKRIMDAFSLSCHKHSYSAVKDYLLSLPEWDGVHRLDTLFCDYLGADDNAYVRAAARKSIVAAVARVMTPGVKYDTMPILAGPQGIGKSTLLRLLGGRWFSDSLSTFEGKEACEMLQGVWINEVGELNGLNRAETNAVKQFLSKVEDIFREPYGRRTGVYPRRCVFFGTTNEAEFLRDKTGNRRFWPIDCGVKGPTKNVFRDLPSEVPQIWAEALIAWRLGEPLYLTGEVLKVAEATQEKHSEQNLKDGVIREFIEREVLPDWDKKTLSQRKIYWQADFQKDSVQKVPREKICAAEIWCECFGGDLKFMKRSDALEINSILQKIEGWQKSDKSMRFGAEFGVQRGFIREKVQ
ncbi:MAG: virulence-associated protein E [Oscillospiraceae bacterium]|nr:virulence-associated protein E [Oscillospiraceae bacterium]